MAQAPDYFAAPQEPLAMMAYFLRAPRKLMRGNQESMCGQNLSVSKT
jgi:hypothetical protein